MGDSMSPSPTFGIDLGTTCSLIGVVEDGQPRLLAIDGSVLVPSVVAFPESGEPIVGSAARNQLMLTPERTLRSTKRRMGSDHRWTIGDRSISAPEVATEILRALVRGAEAQTGTRPERVVVTVPAWFRHDARADTRRAAEAAGLEVARLINEPTAAALAHGHSAPRERLALVYDLGGGTFDASVIHQQGELIEVRASSGDVHLGGDDLDARLLSRMQAELQRVDPALAAAVRASRGARERFLDAVRDAKHELSESVKTTIRAPFLADVDGEARHLELPIDRDLLEEELMPLLERTFTCVDSVLRDARVRPADVEELLLVGGTSRTPLVWEALERRYGWEGSCAVPPQEAVGIGAAIQAAIIDGTGVKGMLLDVTPHALSIAVVSSDHQNLLCEVITPRNAPLPGRHTRRFATMHPAQTELTTPVLQGSDPNPLRNVPLGTIGIDELPPPPAGRSTRPIAIEFRQDLSGLVSIRLTDELSGRTVDGQVTAGGEESAQARQVLIEAIEEGAFIPGDGRDPDPFLERESARGAEIEPLEAWRSSDQDEAKGAGGARAGNDDVEEARSAFETLAARGGELASEHPEHALDLRRLVVRGQEALAAGADDEALAAYDEMSDRMFELGIYL
jgi:molecular chaperone DnaK